MPLFLTSLEFDGLGAWLGAHDVRADVVLVSNASRALPDAEAIVAPARAALEQAGHRPHSLDVRAAPPEALERAGAVVMTGGDPFRLLADLRSSGAGRVLMAAHGRGIPIAGQSAGAIVCARRLDPVRLTSPFAAPAGLDLTGLGLSSTLVLPHHDRNERADRHREAARSGGSVPLTVLWDDEVLLEQPGHWRIVQGTVRTRPAGSADSGAIEALFQLTTRQAWAEFVPAETLARAGADPDRWRRRIADREGLFLVAEDDAGLLGFGYVRPYPAGLPDVAGPVAELDLLYTHPRAWGRGIGRRLLARLTWHLLCQGYPIAVLWTEARNRRALSVYRAGGWEPDGAEDLRDFLGTPIRNLRHRLDLTTRAGAP